MAFSIKNIRMMLRFFGVATKFLNEESLPNALDEIHIALIPHIPCHKEVYHFKPINCYTFNYKIIAKVMANRIKPLLPSLISHFQNVFVEDK